MEAIVFAIDETIAKPEYIEQLKHKILTGSVIDACNEIFFSKCEPYYLTVFLL